RAALLLRPTRARCVCGSCGSFRDGSVVYTQACLWIEEVERARIDDDLGRLARPDARTRAEPADERCRIFSARCELRDGSLVPDVLRELAHVVGHRLLRLDREVRHDLGAKRLGQLDLAAEAAVGRRGWGKRGVLEVLRPD